LIYETEDSLIVVEREKFKDITSELTLMDLKGIKSYIRKNRFLNPLVTAVGILFIFLAVLGAFLPLMPGFVFLIIGLIILGEEFFLTKWILKKSPKKVREHLEKRKKKNSEEGNGKQ